jgi:hypothetical protein
MIGCWIIFAFWLDVVSLAKQLGLRIVPHSRVTEARKKMVFAEM